MCGARTRLLSCLSLVVAALGLPSAASAQTDVRITDGAISAGRLVIQGSTAPNSWVRLDGQVGPELNVRAGADGKFAFGALYHPGDCIVDVQRVLSPAKLGAPAQALVAGCAPRALTMRGAWDAAAEYLAEDVVSFGGATWRAKRGSVGEAPPESTLDWMEFASSSGTATLMAASDSGAVQPYDTPTGAAGGDLSGTYPAPSIRALAVTTAKIADNAVTVDKLAANAVTGGKIVNGTITVADLNNSSVNGAKVIDETLTAADLAASSVGSSEILNGSVAGVDIQSSAIDSSKVLNDSLTTIDFAGGRLSGTITLNAGYVATGRCRDFGVSAPNAQPGDAVIVSLAGSVPHGIVLSGVRVSSDDVAIAKVCNFTGAAFPQLDNIPIAVVTLRM